MTAQILDGRAAAEAIFADVKERVAVRVGEGGQAPFLAAVLVGEDPASESYIRTKRNNCARAGIGSQDHRLPASASEAELLDLVARLDADPGVSAILVQWPLPPQIDPGRIAEAISPVKDVDGFHPFNAGRLAQGAPLAVPCTPLGIIDLLERNGIDMAGREAVIIGRSNLVTKPLAFLMLHRNATITICHSRTVNLAEHCRRADILVAAAGRTYLVEPGWVRPGAVVVDVGVNRHEGRLVGDVHPDVAEVAGWLTPSPGGVGPMTRAMLVRNTLAAEERRRPLR